MPDFDWQSFAELAETLAQGKSAAEHRTAMNRAYYAVYCIAREVADEAGLDVTTRDEGVHRKIWTHYASSRQLRGRIYTDADRLRSRRVASDYKADEISSAGELARDSARRARKLVDRLKKCRQDVLAGKPIFNN